MSTSGTSFLADETGTAAPGVVVDRSIDEAVVDRPDAEPSTVGSDVEALLLTLRSKGLVTVPS